MDRSSGLHWLLLVASCLQLTLCQDAGFALGDFVKQLTSFISHNGGIGSLVNAIRPPGAYPGIGDLAEGDGGYPLKPFYPPQYPGYPPQYPEYTPQYPEYAPLYPDQYPDYQQNTHRPSPYRPHYRPPHQHPEEYPQTYAPGYDPYIPQPPQGLMAALDSITRHDDLRCVPRLLCEVTSGGKPGYPSSETNQQQTMKQTITTLLTVLNFMDNNPLFVFGRAALLGAASKGNSATCIDAYPTCPRDPDRLVHYLNNHNGGFFRFFGGIPSQPYQFRGQVEDTPPANGEARIQNKPAKSLVFPSSAGLEDIEDHLPTSAHSTSKDRFVFPSSSSSTRGGKQLHFPDEGVSYGHPIRNTGSAYKPDFSPPQNLINFRDQRSVKFPLQ